MNPSTQLRAIEGEIERLIPERQCMRYTSGECRTLSCLKAGGYKGGSYDPNIATCEEHALRTLLTIAKELEKDRDTRKQFYENTRAHYDSLRAENATLKRRLDEAPHDSSCPFVPPILRTELQDCAGIFECNCWKSRITEIDKL